MKTECNESWVATAKAMRRPIRGLQSMNRSLGDGGRLNFFSRNIGTRRPGRPTGGQICFAAATFQMRLSSTTALGRGPSNTQIGFRVVLSGEVQSNSKGMKLRRASRLRLLKEIQRIASDARADRAIGRGSLNERSTLACAPTKPDSAAALSSTGLSAGFRIRRLGVRVPQSGPRGRGIHKSSHTGAACLGCIGRRYDAKIGFRSMLLTDPLSEPLCSRPKDGCRCRS